MKIHFGLLSSILTIQHAPPIRIHQNSVYVIDINHIPLSHVLILVSSVHSCLSNFKVFRFALLSLFPPFSKSHQVTSLRNLLSYETIYFHASNVQCTSTLLIFFLWSTVSSKSKNFVTYKIIYYGKHFWYLWTMFSIKHLLSNEKL